MSSVLCSVRHIAAIAAWAHARTYTNNPAKLAQQLRRLNNHTMAHAYNCAPEPLRGFAAVYEQERQAYPDIDYSPEAAAYALALLYSLEYQIQSESARALPSEWAQLQSLIDLARTHAPEGKETSGVWII
jgi:hypothetical protein